MENTPEPTEGEQYWGFSTAKHPAYLSYQQALNDRARALMDPAPLAKADKGVSQDPPHHLAGG